MPPRPPGKHAVAFVFVTVFLDMVGFGLIMPVLPKLIETVSGRDLAGASLLAGWLFFAYGGMQFLFGPVIGNLSPTPMEGGRCCCSRSLGWLSIICSPRLRRR